MESPFYYTFYNKTCEDINFILPLAYDSITTKSQRKKIQVETADNFFCYCRFDQTVKSSTITFMRFSIPDHEVELKSTNGRVQVLLRYLGERQNNYQTNIVIKPLKWIKIRVKIQETKTNLQFGDLQSFTLEHPPKFVFKAEGHVIVSVFPVSVDLSTISSTPSPPNFINSFNEIKHKKNLSFLTALSIQEPLSNEHYLRLKRAFLEPEKEEILIL